jgi:hypothetical protein
VNCQQEKQEGKTTVNEQNEYAACQPKVPSGLIFIRKKNRSKISIIALFFGCSRTIAYLHHNVNVHTKCVYFCYCCMDLPIY